MAIKVNNVTAIDDSRNVSAAGIVTVGSGNSTITIDGLTGIMSVGTGITMQGIPGNISIAGTLTAAGLNVPSAPPRLVSISPSIGQTNVGFKTSIEITLDSFLGIGTNKNIFIRSVSAGGTTFQTISTTGVTIRGATLIISTIPMPSQSVMFPVVPNGFVVGAGGSFAGLNTTGGTTYSYTTAPVSPGAPFGGGFIMCQAASYRWVVAPIAAEVSRSWYSRNDASGYAQAVTGCTGWFNPTGGQMQNPGYVCRTNWDQVSCTGYWGNDGSPYFPLYAYSSVNMVTGSSNYGWKASDQCIRAFRCIAY